MFGSSSTVPPPTTPPWGEVRNGFFGTYHVACTILTIVLNSYLISIILLKVRYTLKCILYAIYRVIQK